MGISYKSMDSFQVFVQLRKGESMKIILRQDIQGLGKMGDIVNVANGYARNYLLPRKMAMEATEHNIQLLEKEKKKMETQLLKSRQEAEELARKIEETTITISKEVGEGEKMFGSVTSADIVEALGKEGISVDKRQIILERSIKKTGLFHIPIKVHPDITATLKLWVVKA